MVSVCHDHLTIPADHTNPRGASERAALTHYTTRGDADSSREAAMQHGELSSRAVLTQGAREEAQGGGSIRIHLAHSLCCTAETNTIL